MNEEPTSTGKAATGTTERRQGEVRRPMSVILSPIREGGTKNGQHHIQPAGLFEKGGSEAAMHPREEERLARLHGLEILDSEPDPVLDCLTEIAANTCNAPIALISLVDRDRQWFKSAHGMNCGETHRKHSLCAHAILDATGALLVEDTHLDARFADNPLVTGEPFIRFYAGFPLTTNDGLPLGTLCVIDRKPRTLDEPRIQILGKLAKLATRVLESQCAGARLRNLLHLEKEVYNRLLRSSSELINVAPTFDDALEYLMNHLDPNLGWLSARIRNIGSGSAGGINYNPTLPTDPELPLLWKMIDATPDQPTNAEASTEFVRSAPDRPEYTHLIVPIRIRSRLAATLEFLYPDHRRIDPRVREVFDLMASNLAIVAERELVNVELLHQATHDHLTGAANRPVIISELEKSIRRSGTSSPDTALFFFDIDGFKEINDNFGHETGDRLLIEIAQRLGANCRPGDLLGRLSGDEFVLLVRNLDIAKGLSPFTERLRKSLSRSFMLGDLEIRISSSIGCVVLTDPRLSPNEILRRAEEAMYLVKSGVRKDFCLADEEVVKEFQARRSLDRKIKAAVHENRLFLVYQPIIDLETGRITGVECLLRMLDEDGKVLPASSFMTALERTRYLPRVDEWVLSEAIRIFHGRTTKRILGMNGFRFSVNVSPAILSGKGFAQSCLSQLQRAGIAPTCLTLEIIESHLLPNNPVLLANLTTLRSLGVHIAVDDFGTGYNNLQHLSSLPIDIMKVDRSFLGGITTGGTTKNALLGAIVGIGKNLGYSIVVEGVEEKAQADYIRNLGCRYVQGFLYARPMPIEDFILYFEFHGGMIPASLMSA